MSRHLPDPEHWRELDEALRELLDIDAGAREEWIEERFQGRPDLANDLRRLVAYAEKAGPLERVGESNAVIDALDALPGAAGTIAGWRLLRRIGAGGMAEVYLAERDNHGVTQRAALKLMARGLGSSDMHARFQRERSILARLTDSRIARYFDGGIAEDGRPWLAMEPIEGLPIDAYCTAHLLPLRARLALFREVCGAVAHAHRHLIVHRDIKPSNVLVSLDGQVKLLDFGIAKPIAESDGDSTRSRLLTPHHASPEQLRGESATTVTDVFLLGLLLYELLVGCRPFVEFEDDPFLHEQALREREAPLPSAALARRLAENPGAAADVQARELRGDLDRIILFALRKDPASRYSSVERFDADIAAWLAGRPVSARGDALGYRLRKWTARHRLAAASIAAAVLMGVIYTALLVHQNRLVAEQRDHARDAAAQASAVRDFLLDLFSEADPSRALGEKLSVGAVLEKGSARIADGFAEQPRVRAEMLHTIGTAWHGLGDHARARDLVGQAVALRRQWPEARVDLSRSLSELAAIERDDSHLEESIALAREAGELAGGDLHARALALNVLGVGLLMHDQDLGAARASLDQAIATYRAWPTPDPVRIAVAQGNRAAIDLTDGRFDEAESGLSEAISVLSPRLGDIHPEVTALLYNLARLEERRGKFADAETHFRRVLAAETEVLGAAHPDVAIDRTRLAYVLAERGKLAEAEQGFSAALAVMREKLPADHKRIAENQMGYAETLVELDRPAEAESLIGEAIGILGKHFEQDDWRIAEARRIQARAWLHLDRRDRALAQLEQIGPILLAQAAPVPDRYRESLDEARGGADTASPSANAKRR
ncbi:serine/threonine-protein kinase [Dokdonella immobilis]|uniref:Serine/threonine protein kinase n=1 Tax=Dokdonella immobilis TaxID=578942 RepID=A0A1I4WZM8_9GAMM|nr:serine/threonine-protein kinase [Dokdonella immobilis]SFN18449.1 serine/threonine protein kinase [Dokdonella immobilis]